MGGSRHRRLSELFRQACELAADERAAFLDRECAGDAALRAELESLLSADGAPAETVTRDLIEVVHLAAADVSPAIPKRLAGYRLERELGSGGSGVVYAATHEETGQVVALKLLSGSLWLSAKQRRRFEREAWIAGRLDHPNIVKVDNHGTAEGFDYYTMELVEGGSLETFLHDMRRHGRDETTGLSYDSDDYTDWVLGQGAKIARALQHAHDRDVVHRDIKPLNLLLGGDPLELRIVDFGIALDGHATRLTTEGKILGTIRYMAPEQLRSGQTIDHRADIYALGATLYEMLTLDYPYEAETHEQYIHAVLHEEVRRSERLRARGGADLEAVIEKALEKPVSARYDHARELAADLENVLHTRRTIARPVGRAGRLLRRARRKPVHAALILALAVGLPVVGSAVSWSLYQQSILRGHEIESLTEELNAMATTGRELELWRKSQALLQIDPKNYVGLRSATTSSFQLQAFESDPDEKNRRIEETLEHLDRWVAAFPERAGPYHLKAYILRSLGREAEAERVRGQVPDDAEPDEDSLFDEANLAFLEGRYADAEESFSAVLDLRTRFDALLGRARVRALRRHYQDAEQDLQLLRSLRPKDFEVSMTLGDVRYRQRRFEEAERYYLQALERGGPQRRLHENLSSNANSWALLLRAQGERDTALEKLRQGEKYARAGLALPDGAESVWLPNNLGNNLVERHRWTRPETDSLLHEAAALFARAAAQPGRQRSAAVANRCDVLIELGQLDEARASCEAYRILEPEDPVAYYNLAGLHALSGRPDEALAALELDLEKGDTDWQYLRDDERFVSLREVSRFQEILRRMREKAGDGPA